MVTEAFLVRKCNDRISTVRDHQLWCRLQTGARTPWMHGRELDFIAVYERHVGNADLGIARQEDVEDTESKDI